MDDHKTSRKRTSAKRFYKMPAAKRRKFDVRGYDTAGGRSLTNDRRSFRRKKLHAAKAHSKYHIGVSGKMPLSARRRKH